MNSKIIICIILVLFCEAIFFNIINNVECQFILGLLISWLFIDYVISFLTNDFYKNGYYQEYHTSYNQKQTDYQSYKPKNNYNDYSYTPPMHKSRSDIESDLIRAIKPNMNIIISNDESIQKKITDKKEAYCQMLADKTKKLQIEKPSVTKKQTPKETKVSTALLPIKAESTVSKPKKEIASSLILIDNNASLSDNKKQIYDAIINYFNNAKLNVCVIRELIQNFVYVDVIESTDGKTANVVIYINDFNIMLTHKLNFSDLVQNIRDKCKNVNSVGFKKVLYQTVLNYYDSFSKL